MKFWFWFPWAIDAVIAAVALYFFFSLAAGGRVGLFNILPWLAILAALAAVVGGSVWLRSAGQHAVAIVVLLLFDAGYNHEGLLCRRHACHYSVPN